MSLQYPDPNSARLFVTGARGGLLYSAILRDSAVSAALREGLPMILSRGGVGARRGLLYSAILRGSAGSAREIAGNSFTQALPHPAALSNFNSTTP
jgi:hypothetical protein